MDSSRLFSVILLSFQSEARIHAITDYYIKGLEEADIPFEFIIIDDGSTDRSFELAQGLAEEDERIRAFQLSKNYTSPYAQFAGLSVCRGACAMFVSDDFQRPLDNLIASYRKWEEGHKIVISYRHSRDDGRLTHTFSNGYYALMNRFSDVNFPKGGSDGFLADREVIDILNERISPIRTSAIAEVLRLGFDPCFIPLYRPPSEVKSRWTMRKKLRLAADTFFATSSFPIRFITWLGFVMFAVSIVFIIAVVLAKLFTDNRLLGFPIPGWATTVMLIALFNGLTLFALGIVAEYIWRIYEEVKGRPGYIIRK